MKLMLLAAVALAGLMEEANDGTTGSSGGAATESKPPEPAAGVSDSLASNEAAKTDTAPDIADTSGDTPGQPAGAHLDAPAAAAGTETDLATKPDFVHLQDGAVCLVTKGCDKIPVQVKDKAHYDRLVAEHGAGSVEILAAGAA